MKFAFNAYVAKVLEAMVGPDMPLKTAKAVCRSKIQELEQHYVRLHDVDAVAAEFKLS